MRSDARVKLHKRFDELSVGDHFQMVNTIMGAAVPNAYVLEKVYPIEGKNAIRQDTGDPVHIFPETLVEIVRPRKLD